ncbi:hypothetical protein L1887_13766 [Cichorium endivia]|nr:hypothetical protein L1887_13766 [Cichorium endivia]
MNSFFSTHITKLKELNLYNPYNPYESIEDKLMHLLSRSYQLDHALLVVKGINDIVDNCYSLEELSVKQLRNIMYPDLAEPIRPGLATSSPKMYCLKDLYNGQCFAPLIIGSKNLRTLRLFRCFGDWDAVLKLVTNNVKGLNEALLERLQAVGDYSFDTFYTQTSFLSKTKCFKCNKSSFWGSSFFSHYRHRECEI